MRENKIREAIEETKLFIEEAKQNVAMEDMALKWLIYDRNND